MQRLVHHLLRTSAERFPDKEALIHRDRRLSFEELDAASDRVGNALVESGLRRQDRVGIILQKSVDEALGILGTSKADGVFVPINHMLFPAQIEHILADCKPRAIVTTRNKVDDLRDVLARCPWVEIVVVVDGPGDAVPGATLLDMADVVERGGRGRPADASISHDLAAILYTSGSTGKPKGVMVSHANLVAGSRIVSTYLGITSEDRILSVLPFSFDYGLNQLLTGLEHAATVILLNFTFPDQVVQAVINERATGLAGVPPFWSVFSQPGSSAHKHDLSGLRYITNSGGAVPGPLLENLRSALPGTDIVLMYGLTEAFRSTYLPPSEIDNRPGSMGKAIPDTEIYVLGDDGRPCPPGEPGELVHRGPTVSLGYWGQPDATDRVIRPNPFLPEELGDCERVCYSGDLVRMDEDGFLYFIGRRDATIKCAGYRISPTEIEDVVVSMDEAREAAAVGVPDDLMGQAVMVYVVPHEGRTVEERALIDHCAESMPRYMIPRHVEIVSELPKTAHGKIDYPTLKKRAVEGGGG